jgi:hypothetical protein
MRQLQCPRPKCKTKADEAYKSCQNTPAEISTNQHRVHKFRNLVRDDRKASRVCAAITEYAIVYAAAADPDVKKASTVLIVQEIKANAMLFREADEKTSMSKNCLTFK